MEQTAVSGFNVFLGNVSNLGRRAQAIVGEIAKMSEENIGASTKAAERLREARSYRDVTSIQTDLMKESYECTTAHYRKIAEIAATTPQEMAQGYRELISAITEAGQETAERASDAMRRAGEQTADVARKAADTTRSAAESAQRAARG